MPADEQMQHEQFQRSIANVQQRSRSERSSLANYGPGATSAYGIVFSSTDGEPSSNDVGHSARERRHDDANAAADAT